jgi:hypothetical protein
MPVVQVAQVMARIGLLWEMVSACYVQNVMPEEVLGLLALVARRVWDGLLVQDCSQWKMTLIQEAMALWDLVAQQKLVVRAAAARSE